MINVPGARKIPSFPLYRIVYFHPRLAEKRKLPGVLLVKEGRFQEALMFDFPFQEYLTKYGPGCFSLFKNGCQTIIKFNLWNQLPDSVGPHWELGEITWKKT